jgi:5-methylcytosine-specific restriction endonuclease McrA
VASYKFALGQALLELGARQQTFTPLPDLAVPYATGLCEHLQIEDRQSTSAQSQFLDACRSRNRGELEVAQLAEFTVRLGFTNVIDAFHVSCGGQPTQTRFFVDERASRQGITLTDHLRPITGVRDALSPYQDGRCAYCHTEFTDIGTTRVAVDHVLPFVLMTREWQDGDLHQVWNLVLACYACNSAKRDRPPAADWMPWLEQRGEYLIASHHPLRETLISQLGPDPAHRHQTLAHVTPRPRR